jgi:hypothetical protein
MKFTSLLLLTALFLYVPDASAQGDVIAIVVNPANSTAAISLGDLRKMFTGARRSWPGGEPVKLITRGPGCLERLALLKLVAMSENEYKQYWTRQVFRGEADSAPLVVPSVGMQKEAIAAFPGAISLVSFKDVKPGMKVIKVDGLMPGAEGYPLH